MLRMGTVIALIFATILLEPYPFFMVAVADGAQHESSEEASATVSNWSFVKLKEKANGEEGPAWWQRHLAFSGDVRAALAVAIRGGRGGANQTETLPVVRLRGGATVSPTPWLTGTARLAGFFDKEIDGLGFRLSHRRTIRSGDVTFDSLFLTLRPHELFTAKIGRLQTEGRPFELDSVVEDTLSRHDSSGFDVNWTDGVYLIIGRSSSFKLHLIGQLNPEDGPTNDVGIRGPVGFRGGASRVTYYVGAEAPPLPPFTQLVADVTIIPQALRPFGLGTELKEDLVAFTVRAAADVALQAGTTPLTLHPSAEFGAMLSTPGESVLGISTSHQRAERFAFVAGLDLKPLGPGVLGFQFGWTQSGYLISPDYPNNAWSIEARYKVGIGRHVVWEISYRHRQDITTLVTAPKRETDDTIVARISLEF